MIVFGHLTPCGHFLAAIRRQVCHFLPVSERPLTCCTHGWGRTKKLSHLKVERRYIVKYLFAWGLGVPGVLIVTWFLMNHH
jgi:hypothetical protein